MVLLVFTEGLAKATPGVVERERSNRARIWSSPWSKKLPTDRLVPAETVAPKVLFVVLATSKINPVVGKSVVEVVERKRFASRSNETV